MPWRGVGGICLVVGQLRLSVQLHLCILLYQFIQLILSSYLEGRPLPALTLVMVLMPQLRARAVTKAANASAATTRRRRTSAAAAVAAADGEAGEDGGERKRGNGAAADRTSAVAADEGGDDDGEVVQGALMSPCARMHGAPRDPRKELSFLFNIYIYIIKILKIYTMSK